MKKILFFLVAMIAVFTLAIGVFAVETAYIKDALQRVEESRLTELEETAKGLKTKYGIGVFLAYVKGHADDVKPEEIVGEEADYVLLMLGEQGTRIYTGGKGDEIFTEAEDRDRLGYVHDEQDEWADGIARYLEVTEEYFEDAFAESDPADPAETVPAETAEESVPEESSDTKEEEGKSGSFNFGYLIPILAAVIAAVVAVFVILRKKKA